MLMTRPGYGLGGGLSSGSRLATQAVRRLTTSAARPAAKGEVHPGYAKLRQQYEKFQVPDGVPVHLKGGPSDKILAMTTYGLCGIGLVTVFYTLFYKMAFPQKKE